MIFFFFFFFKKKMCQSLNEQIEQLQQSLRDLEHATGEKVKGLTESLELFKSRNAELEQEAENLRTESAAIGQQHGRRLAAAVEERELWRNRATILSEELEKALNTDLEQRHAAEKMLSTVNYLKCEAGRLAKAWSEAQNVRDAAKKENEEARKRMDEMAKEAEEHAEHVDRVEHRCKEKRSVFFFSFFCDCNY